MEFEKNIEELIRTKTFQQLTELERAMVLKRISEKEYDQFRLILCGTINQLNERVTFPSPRVKENLMLAIREKQRKRKPVTMFLTKVGHFQVPMWQVAATFVGLLFMAVWSKNQVILNSNANNFGTAQIVLVDTVFETKYDTVYREIPAAHLAGKKVNVSPEKLFLEPEKIAPFHQHFVKNIQQTNEKKYDDFAGILTQQPLLADTTLPRKLRELEKDDHGLWNKKSVGRSVKQDAELIQFFTEIN